MTNLNSYAARGKIIEKHDGHVVFKPVGTNYELMLDQATPYEGPVNTPVELLIRVIARKVYSVPSGGNFVTPIFGPPKIIQGRVKFLDGRNIVVHAGTNFVVTLPSGDSAIDLNNGAIGVGSRVNVVALPGSTFEPVEQSVAAG